MVVTGRPERTRKDTEKWLRKHGVPFHVLHMRGDGDRRPDSEVKKDILDKYFVKENIEAAFK